MEELVGRERSLYYDHYPDKRWFLYMSTGIWPSDKGGGRAMTRGNAMQGLDVTGRPCEGDAASCVCELATILILFVQTDPVPFYFQLVENKLVLFLLSVAMTTQPLFFRFGGSREVKEKQIRPLFLGTFFKVFNIYNPGESCSVSEERPEFCCFFAFC